MVKSKIDISIKYIFPNLDLYLYILDLWNEYEKLFVINLFSKISFYNKKINLVLNITISYIYIYIYMDITQS